MTNETMTSTRVKPVQCVRFFGCAKCNDISQIQLNTDYCWQAAGAVVLALKKQLRFHTMEYGVGLKPKIL
jgi:hypothetical protein